MLVSDIYENRIVTISGGKNKKGFQTLDFKDMLTDKAKQNKKQFKKIDFKKMKKDSPVSHQ